MTKETILVHSSYRVYDWFDDSENQVLVTACDNNSVTIKYRDDGLINRVPIDYFRDELKASLKTYEPVFILTCRCGCGCKQTHNRSANFCENCLVGACLPTSK